MKDSSKTNQELLEENSTLKRRIKELERSESNHKLLVKKHRRDKENLRILIEHNPAAIALFDREMRYIAASRRYLIDYGLGEQTLVGRSHCDVFPELTDRLKEVHRRCLAGSIEKADEEPFLRADGRIDWVRWEVRPWYELGGGIGGIILFSEVITESKRAEEALLKSEEKFRKAFYTGPDAVNINRLEDGMYVSINPGFTRITGYAEEDIIGKTSIELNIWDNIEDRQRLVAGLKKDGEVTNLETAFRMKSGDIRYGLMSASMIDLNSVPHILSITRDITDRKRAEELVRTLSSRQEALLDAVPEIIMEVDNNKVYTWANSVGVEFFGEDVIGKEATFYFEGEQETYDIVAPLFNGAEDVIYVESWQRRKDGEKRLLAWWCRVLKDESGQVTGALSSARDITEHEHAEETLRKSEERFRAIFLITPWTGIYQSTSNELVNQCNKAFQQDVRLRIPDLKKSLTTVMNIGDQMYENPDDRKKAVGIFKEMGHTKKL